MTGKSSGSPSAARRSSAPARPWVLLDANVLFLMARRRFPLDEEVARQRPGAVVAVPTSVVGEMDRLVEEGTPDSMAARALVERYPRAATTGRGDAGVMSAARRLGAWVVTGDRELILRLTNQGVTVLRPRDRHRLERVGGRPAAPDGTARRVRSRKARGNS